MAKRRISYIRDRRFVVKRWQRIGRKEYGIVKTLRGGRYRRYQAVDPSMGPNGDLCLVHVLPSHQTSQQRLEVLRRLSQANPNLPTILEWDRRGSEIWLVTAWTWGVDLESHLSDARNGRIAWPSPIETCRLIRGLAHCMHQMHRGRYLIHGDTKPSNLVLAREPNRLVLIDFGNAWSVEKTSQRVPGDGQTEHYAAPELLTGKPAPDFRSDIFSVSVVAYEMLTGDIPYSRMGGKAGLPKSRSLFAHRYEPPSARCPLRRHIPRRIWRLIDRVVTNGLALDREMRYGTGGTWLDEWDDVHFDIRRRRRFRAWDQALCRLFDWMDRGKTLVRKAALR